jgi:hypothetical protein
MKTVHFLIQGNFGDNFFQYLASEVIKKIYGYDEVKPTFYINLEFNTVINDLTYKEIMLAHMEGNKIEIDTSKDILLMGYFQRSEIMKYEREFLKGLFHAGNTNNISNRIKIGNIVNYQSKHNVQPTEEDLTLHLPCEDLWDDEMKRSQIFDPEGLKEIISTIPHKTLYIVRNMPSLKWEKEYYEQFDSLNPIWINGNLGDDFDFLMKSSKLITSASCMSYLAAYFGNASEVHIPYHSYYGGEDGVNQHLAEFNDTCKVYRSIEYWYPTIEHEKQLDSTSASLSNSAQ